MSLKKKVRGGKGERRRVQKISILATLPVPDSGPEKLKIKKKKARFKLAVYASHHDRAEISTFLHLETATPAESSRGHDGTVCHILKETSQTCRN